MSSQIEQQRRDLADELHVAFRTPERLAEFLHQNYRATAKAMWRLHDNGVEMGCGHHTLLHDHGYGDCYGKKKEYFLRRAKWLMQRDSHFNGRVKNE